MNTKYNEIKNELKEFAKEIRFLKSQRKPGNRTIDLSSNMIETRIENASFSFRLKHIAMSLYRGHTYEQIESTVSDEKALSSYDWEKINQIKDELEKAKTSEQMVA